MASVLSTNSALLLLYLLLAVLLTCALSYNELVIMLLQLVHQ